VHLEALHLKTAFLSVNSCGRAKVRYGQGKLESFAAPRALVEPLKPGTQGEFAQGQEPRIPLSDV
jgi:hypothetical protein